MSDPTDVASGTVTAGISTEGLLPELVEHLRQNRTGLREEWAHRSSWQAGTNRARRWRRRHRSQDGRVSGADRKQAP